MLALSGLVRRRGAFANCVRAVVCTFTDAKPPTFEELLYDGSSQSLDRAAKMLVDLQHKQKSQLSQATDLRNKMSRLGKTTEDLQKKLQVLLRNVKDQDEQLVLIRKRSQKQRIQSAKDFALTKFAKDVIEVSDNLKKCSQLAQKKFAEKPDDFLKKLAECNDELFGVLARHEIQEFDPIGQPYDANSQESMVEVPDPSKPNGTVAMVTQTGYTIKGRLLRSAKVCVYRS